MYLWSGNTVPFLHRIEFPDRKGPDVGFKQDFRTMPFYPPWLLPTFVDYDMGPVLGEPCNTATYGIQIPDLRIYPNPASEQIRAEGLSTALEAAGLQITDAQGHQVFSGIGMDLIKGIQVADWKPGIYFIQIDSRPAGRFAKM